METPIFIHHISQIIQIMGVCNHCYTQQCDLETFTPWCTRSPNSYGGSKWARGFWPETIRLHRFWVKNRKQKKEIHGWIWMVGCISCYPLWVASVARFLWRYTMFHLETRTKQMPTLGAAAKLHLSPVLHLPVSTTPRPCVAAKSLRQHIFGLQSSGHVRTVSLWKQTTFRCKTVTNMRCDSTIHPLFQKKNAVQLWSVKKLETAKKSCSPAKPNFNKLSLLVHLGV